MAKTILKTTNFRNLYEDQARENVQDEINHLL